MKSKTTHREDLQDERWRKKRYSVLARAMFKCSKCEFEGILDVHHLYYIKGKRLWEYPYNALVALCRDCHEKWHQEHQLEYRAEVWSENKDYEAPSKRKTYYVTKGRKSVRKKMPYKKAKGRNRIMKPSFKMLSPLERGKWIIRIKAKKGLVKSSFSPIPEWRLKLKEQLQGP